MIYMICMVYMIYMVCMYGLYDLYNLYDLYDMYDLYGMYYLYYLYYVYDLDRDLSGVCMFMFGCSFGFVLGCVWQCILKQVSASPVVQQ